MSWRRTVVAPLTSQLPSLASRRTMMIMPLSSGSGRSAERCLSVMRALSDVYSLVNALYFLTLTLPTLPSIDRYKGRCPPGIDLLRWAENRLLRPVFYTPSEEVVREIVWASGGKPLSKLFTIHQAALSPDKKISGGQPLSERKITIA